MTTVIDLVRVVGQTAGSNLISRSKFSPIAYTTTVVDLAKILAKHFQFKHIDTSKIWLVD
jgi:hypothetical protein